VQHADDVVDVRTVHRQTRVPAARDLRDDVAQRRMGGDGDELGARHHHLPGGQIGEAEDAVEHLLLLLLEHAGFLARGHQHLQLFFGVHHRAVVGAFQAERGDDRVSGAVDEADERPQRAHEQLERAHDPHRRRLGSLERDPFRRQLAEDDLDGGDDGECDGDRDRVRSGGGDVRRHELERRLDHRRQRRLADPSEPEARHRDAELRRRDVPIGRADGAAHRARAAVAFGDQLIDPRLPHRDDREFGCDEESVRAHERREADEPPQHIHG
jgi:hypothetical protein